ncbi:hypothetical protein [Sutcliffiella rhizosphaerae]|uniref:hypothetical protein n=1 Tax=Sutcliffiella rhizosphaerae TaxID=2880967 RepID=UPI001E28D5AF|nr:hypothetical protein [Sutcliffiella rhizosphaerae]
MFSLSEGVQAGYTNEEFQQELFELGYSEVHFALKESEAHFKKDIALPVQMHPIEFTHSFGRFSNMNGELNGRFEIEYIHVNKTDNHYMIGITPKKDGKQFREELIDKTYKLKNGSEAIYTTNFARGFNILMFENEGLQYTLSINKAVSDQVKPETLVEIANSIFQ